MAKVTKAALREALLALDNFVRHYALPMPEDIASAFKKIPLSPLGLYVRIAVIREMSEPPALSDRPTRDEIEDLYYYFALHEYFELRRKILMNEDIDIDKEFPALYNLLRVISRMLFSQVMSDEE